MLSEQEISNNASWEVVAKSIEEYPDNTYWIPWKALARRFLRESMHLGLPRYFRAGTSMHHLVFSTCHHHRLRDEPRVTIELHPESKLRIAYGKCNLYSGFPELEYSLPFEEGMATFRRFLNQLWIATVPEPVPEDMRGSIAPVLTPRGRQSR